MTDKQMEAIRLIEEQQAKLPEWHPARMVGEHLKQITRDDPDAAALLAEDLRVKGKGIEDAEKKIKTRADELEKVRKKEKGGNGAVAVMPWDAEDILRKFYGLRERSWGPGKEAEGRDATSSGPAGHLPLKGKASERGNVIDLTEFF